MYDWKLFLQISRDVLGTGRVDPKYGDSWCAFTTFSSLRHGVHYWCVGLPEKAELLDDRTADGGLWRQSFMYDDLAHVVIPREFYWESTENGGFDYGYKTQDLAALAAALERAELHFRQTDLVLEVKLY